MTDITFENKTTRNRCEALRKLIKEETDNSVIEEKAWNLVDKNNEIFYS